MEEGIEIGKVGLPWLSTTQGTWVQSLVGELIPHYFFGTTKKEKKQKKQGMTPVLKELFTRGKGHIQKKLPEVLGVKIGEGRERESTKPCWVQNQVLTFEC